MGSSHGCTRLLAQRLGVGQLDERRADGWAESVGRRSRRRRAAEGVGVPQGAVADQQHLLAAGHELGGQVLGRADLGLGDPLHAAGHLPVEGVEHLAAAGVDHRGDQPVGEPAGKASRSRLGTPIIGTRSAWAIALAVATPTRRPVNSPGPRSTATTPISSSSCGPAGR